MHLYKKKIASKKCCKALWLKVQYEKGYVLAIALLTMLVLMAVSTLVYTVSTKDMRVSTRILGEQKAFAAAEAGVHALLSASNSNNGNLTTWSSITVVVNPSIDPDTKYTIIDASVGGAPAQIPIPGYEVGGVNNKNWGNSVSTKGVTGTNTRYGSSVTLDVGVGFGPVEISTGQPAAGG